MPELVESEVTLPDISVTEKVTVPEEVNMTETEEILPETVFQKKCSQ